jgi:hypothetical protein
MAYFPDGDGFPTEPTAAPSIQQRRHLFLQQRDQLRLVALVFIGDPEHVDRPLPKNSAEPLSDFVPMMPFHNEDHICGGNDALVDYAACSGIEPGGRDLKPRPHRNSVSAVGLRSRLLVQTNKTCMSSAYHDPA